MTFHRQSCTKCACCCIHVC